MGKSLTHAEAASSGNDDVVPVFLTGGWDSTFRVLDLVVHYGCRVQPIYVINKVRRSWHIEMDTIERIREQLTIFYPDRAQLLAPTLYLDRVDLEATEDTNHLYLEFASKAQTSTQYSYLAKVAEKTGLSKIEVSIHQEDNVSNIDFLRERLTEVRLGCGAATNELEPWEASSPFENAMKVFEDFRFPLMLMHPNELEVISEEHGLTSLLSSAWTCHIPIKGAPCGLCGTCKAAIKAGKTHYYPKSALIRYRFAPILTPIWIMISNPRGGIRAIGKRLRK